MSFEKDVKKIDKRSWEIVKSKWMAYLPSFEFPGAPPQEELSDFFGIDEIAKKTLATPGEYREEIKNLRSEVFREGIYLFHKASHVCKSGLVHLDNNIITWSLSSAYHSSFFSLKSIFCLLGLSFPRISSIGGRCMMVDCFPKEEELSSNQRKKGIQPKQDLKFVVFPSLSHQHYWEILHRVLEITQVPLWTEESINYLQKLRATDFAFHRNSLHYKNNHWLIPDDLFTLSPNDEFGIFEDMKAAYDKVSVETNDFPFFLAYLLMQMAYVLIKDMAESAPILADEFELINRFIKTQETERMQKSIPY